MKIGFLGGSFDPIHLGHLVIAQDAFEGCGLDRLEFIPAAESPLKGRELTASSAQRLEMVRLALAGEPISGEVVLSAYRDCVASVAAACPGAA